MHGLSVGHRMVSSTKRTLAGQFGETIVMSWLIGCNRAWKGVRSFQVGPDPIFSILLTDGSRSRCSDLFVPFIIPFDVGDSTVELVDVQNLLYEVCVPALKVT